MKTTDFANKIFQGMLDFNGGFCTFEEEIAFQMAAKQMAEMHSHKFYVSEKKYVSLVPLVLDGVFSYN